MYVRLAFAVAAHLEPEILLSHQLNQIRRLWHRVIWVPDGQIRQVCLKAYGSPLDTGIQAGHAEAAVGKLPGNIQLPDCLGRRSLRDFKDRGIIRR
jgi:hypothetical protein